MKNTAEVLKLDNSNLQELSVEEMQKVDGGVVPFLVIGAYVGAGTAIVAGGYAAGKWVSKHYYRNKK